MVDFSIALLPGGGEDFELPDIRSSFMSRDMSC